MTTRLLTTPGDLLFIVPLGLGVIYLGTYTLTGLGFGEIDHDVDHDVNADHDFDADHDADADQEADADHDVDSSPLSAALDWIGVGRAPIGLLLMVGLMSFGVIGLSIARLTVLSTWIAGTISAVTTLMLLHYIARSFARWLPTNETYARRRHALLGTVAEALYPIDSTFGMAVGKDDRGEPFQVACVVDADQPAVPKGAMVKLVGYSAGPRMFHVVPAAKASALATTESVGRP